MKRAQKQHTRRAPLDQRRDYKAGKSADSFIRVYKDTNTKHSSSYLRQYEHDNSLSVCIYTLHHPLLPSKHTATSKKTQTTTNSGYCICKRSHAHMWHLDRSAGQKISDSEKGLSNVELYIPAGLGGSSFL